MPDSNNGKVLDLATVQKIKAALLSRKARLDGEMTSRELEQGVLEQGDSQAELVDLAQSLELIERNTNLQDQERREVASINAALQRMSLGNYGQCEDCDEAIPVKRLLAVPEAAVCARCQSIRERQRARQAAGSLAG